MAAAPLHASRVAALRACGDSSDSDAQLEAALGDAPQPLIFDTIEPSARLTVAQGLLKAHHMRICASANFQYTLWIGDWFAMINNKLDADLKKIQTIAKYMIEVRVRCGGWMERCT